MGARKLYEEKLLELIKNLPEDELPQVIQMIEKRNSQLEAVQEICGKYAHVNYSSEDFSSNKKIEKNLDK